MSTKLGAPKQLKAIDIIPDESQDLSALIEAYMPGKSVKATYTLELILGNFWKHAGTIGVSMFCSNADAARFKAKQHPCVSLHLSKTHLWMTSS